MQPRRARARRRQAANEAGQAPDAAASELQEANRQLLAAGLDAQAQAETQAALNAALHELLEVRERAAAEREELLTREQAARADAQAATRRQALLAEAGPALASSLDVEAALRRVAGLLVPFLADFCAFDLLDEDGRIRRAAWARDDAAQQPEFDELFRFVPPRDATNHPVPRVLATGRPELFPDVDESWMPASATSEEHLRFVRAAESCSAMIVPVVGQNGVVGAFVLCRTPQSKRRYTLADLDLATDLASRVAQAVDNARLHAVERVARTEAEAALRVRDEFLAIAAHELRTPVTYVSGSAQLALRVFHPSTPADERIHRQLRRINEAAERLAALISDLLDVSRMQSGVPIIRLERLDLASLVRTVAERYGERLAEPRRLSVDVRDRVLLIDGDALRLEQVLDNLLSNAVKYSPDGPEIAIRLYGDENGAVLSVTDAGIGLPPSDRERIFEPFGRAGNAARRGVPGMGLGLHICKQIVEMHGGRIWAVSDGEGHGTTVSVWLPAVQAAPTPA